MTGTSKPPTVTTRCLPQGVCSWDFRLESGDETSTVTFDILREAGELVVGELHFEIKKTSMFVGHWTLWYKGQQVAEAKKPSSLHRTFELSSEDGMFVVEPYAVMSYRFIIKAGDKLVGRIEPDHMFTRRATIFLDHEMPRHLMAFAFWLTVLMKRRAAQSAG